MTTTMTTTDDDDDDDADAATTTVAGPGVRRRALSCRQLKPVPEPPESGIDICCSPCCSPVLTARAQTFP